MSDHCTENGGGVIFEMEPITTVYTRRFGTSEGAGFEDGKLEVGLLGVGEGEVLVV
jgi:hypothetical protein